MKDLIIYVLIVIISIIVVIGVCLGANKLNITINGVYTVHTYKDTNNNEYLVFTSDDGIAVTPRLGEEMRK